MKLSKLITIVFILVISNQTIAEENSLLGLKRQMNEMIGMLDSSDTKNMEDFIKKYSVGSELSSELNFSQLNELIESFSKNKKGELQSLLVKAIKLTPTTEADSVTYSFNQLGLKFNYSDKTKQFHLVNK